MNARAMFVRATPEVVAFKEVYHYTQVISKNPSLKELRDLPPEGTLRVVYPYKAEGAFPLQAREDVRFALNGPPIPRTGLQILSFLKYHALRLGRGGGQQHAPTLMAGRLVMMSDERANLREHVQRKSGFSTIPFELPSAPLRCEPGDSPFNGTQEARHEQAFVPEWPTARPLQLHISLWDEDAFQGPIGAANSGDEDGQIIKDVVTRIREHNNCSRSLLLVIQAIGHFPREMFDGQAVVKVNRVRLQWPTITSLDGLNVSLLRLPGPSPQVRYFPEAGQLGWEDIPMYHTGGGPSDEIWEYKSPDMALAIRHPGELYKEAQLQGEVEVVADNGLLSGMVPRLFDATGVRLHGNALKLRTVVRSQFNVHLDQAFERRPRSPHTWLRFEGVVPDNMRVADVEVTLKQQGFTIECSDRQDGESSKMLHYIRAERKSGADDMEMHVVLEGRYQKLHLRKKLDDGMAYASGDELSGSLDIHVQGRIHGNPTALAKEMNDFQAGLRRRFAAVKQNT